MSDTERTTCTCPLIDVSDYTTISFLRGDPRGSGCPLHETEEMRDEIQTAMDYARYSDTRDMPKPKWMQRAEQRAAPKPPPDATWIEVAYAKDAERRKALPWWKRIMG
jgi:hypothetical protein